MAYLNPTAGQSRASAGSAETAAVLTAIPTATVAAVAGLTPAGGTGATAGAYDTSANRDVLIATVAEIKARLNEVTARLKTAGIVTT